MNLLREARYASCAARFSLAYVVQLVGKTLVGTPLDRVGVAANKSSGELLRGVVRDLQTGEMRVLVAYLVKEIERRRAEEE